MDRIAIRAALSIALAAVNGLLLAYATEIGLALSIAMPTLCFLQKRRLHAFLVAFAYYGAASSILIPAAKTFFGPGSLQLPVALCGIAAFLLALPFGSLWCTDRFSVRWRAPLAVLISVPPPLGIIGWANPLTAAGILFPGTGWFGLAAVLGFSALSVLCLRSSSTALIAAAIVANAIFPGIPAPPTDWEAIDTTFGDMGLETSNMLKQLQVARYVQQRALESEARIIVFPEAVIPRWSEATDLFWERTLLRLESNGKTLLIGAGIDIVDGTKYRNVVVIRGSESGMFVQRIPVPIGMWHPFGESGVPLAPFGPTVMAAGGQRIAILIGYEQFLTWPVLSSLGSRTSLLAGIANHHWSNGTRLMNVQRELLSVWARLFDTPWISATNI